jgi:hypothetical protein
MSHYVPFTLLKKNLPFLSLPFQQFLALIIFLKETEVYVFILHFYTYFASLKGPKHESFGSEFLSSIKAFLGG